MEPEATDNLRVQRIDPLASPTELKAALPLGAEAARFVRDARRQIEAILTGRDPRILAIVGPCSVHDPAAALEYAQRLAGVQERLGDRLLICMRAYFDKPRTTVGWKGLINDPHLDGSCDVGHGLQLARTLLLDLAELRIAAATELLDPVVPQYLADAISWTAIGARTTESQTHREMASGLSMPVGFKNGTDGGYDVAVHAMQAARAAHSFLGIDGSGRAGVVRTTGNPHTHLVLRGGRNGPNYQRAEVERAAARLHKADVCPRVLIDCSHDNSNKNWEAQASVLADVASQLEAGSPHILGVMLESHLRSGRQDFSKDRTPVYGQSITDACLGFDTTEALLYRLAGANRGRAVPGRVDPAA